MPSLEPITLPETPLEWTLPLREGVGAPRIARHQTADLLSRWDLQCLTDDALLVVSELVGNTVRHGRFPAELRLSWAGREVHVEVRDSSPALPQPRATSLDEPGGFGLRIVDQLSDRWGVTPLEQGKAVWAALCVQPE